MEELIAEILDELNIEYADEPTYSEDIMEVKVKSAVREVRMKRNYSATTWTEEKIIEDLYNYFSTISNIARYDYNMIGAEFEVAHNENNVTREYMNRDELFKGVHAFVHVLL